MAIMTLMIDITITQTITPAVKLFKTNEWTNAGWKHVGRGIHGEEQHYAIIARENEEIVGLLELSMRSGVMSVGSVIVKHTRQKMGIGSMLVHKAEEFAGEKNLHKIYLFTGKNWPSVRFYEKLGFEKSGELPNHFGKIDYVEFTKFL